MTCSFVFYYYQTLNLGSNIFFFLLIFFDKYYSLSFVKYKVYSKYNTNTYWIKYKSLVTEKEQYFMF